MVGTGQVNGLKRYDVDDIKREWFDPSKSGGEIQKSTINERLVEQFRLLEPV